MTKTTKTTKTPKFPGKWTVLMDGDDLKECREIAPGMYQVIDITDMIAACGEGTDSEPFHGSLSLVDLNALSDKDKYDALRCIGAENDGNMPVLGLVDACHSYGHYAPLANVDTKGSVVARRKLRSEAKGLIDADALDAALDKVVNKIGSTAREFMRGDFTSAMQRGAEAGDPTARLMAKMHGVPQDVIDDVRPDDFLPYVMGYMRALGGQDVNDADDDYAPEYTRGFERGLRVRRGECPAPSWLKTEQQKVGGHTVVSTTINHG